MKNTGTLGVVMSTRSKKNKSRAENVYCTQHILAMLPLSLVVIDIIIESVSKNHLNTYTITAITTMWTTIAALTTCIKRNEARSIPL